VNLSFWKLLVLVFVILMVFGPKKIPELSRAVGRAVREFRRAMAELEDQLNAEAEAKKGPEATPTAPTATSVESPPIADTAEQGAPNLEPPDGRPPEPAPVATAVIISTSPDAATPSTRETQPPEGGITRQAPSEDASSAQGDKRNQPGDGCFKKQL
jgi:sec-independent protein translocase protein TatA